MKIFKVGGCVRDKLLNKQPNDVDYVVIGSTSEEMLSNGYKLVGNNFPVFLSDDGEEYALARTERKDGEGYNGFITNHDSNVTLEDDCSRRDLTINAMAEDVDTGEIFDPHGGIDDLNNKILRNVSTAFAEDPVRVLRLARFGSQFGSEWKIAFETKYLIAQMIDDGILSELTQERVWKEFYKALKSDNTYIFFEMLFDIGALSIIFPELCVFSVDELCEMMEHAKKHSFTPIQKLGYLFVNLRQYNLDSALTFIIDLKLKRPHYNEIMKINEMYNIYEGVYDIKYIINAFSNLSLNDFHNSIYVTTNKEFFKLICKAYATCQEITYDGLPYDIKSSDGQTIGNALYNKKVIALEKLMPLPKHVNT